MAGELVKRAGAGRPSERELALAALAAIADGRQAKPEERTMALRGLAEAWRNPTQAVALLRGIGRAGIESQALQVRSRLDDAQKEVREAAAFAATRLALDADAPVDPKVPRLAAIPIADVVTRLDGAKGDARVGQRLFSRQGCIACHAVAADEPARGPSLIGIASRSSRAEVAESILRPSAKVLPAFATQVFVTDDGRIHQGFVSREADDEIEIRDAAGIATVLRREQIEQQSKSDVSPMPQGLVDTLTFEQFVSLLAYLDMLK
jgi:putative heme-binding domain-containing protein